MRDRSIQTWAAALAGALLVACGEPPPEPAQQVPPPARGSRAIAAFTVAITPAVPGPGLGQTPGSTVWQEVPSATGGGSNVNPPRTVEIYSSSPFALVRPGTVGACATGYISAPVVIKNYFPERLVDLHVALTDISDSARGLCVEGAQPTGNGAAPWGGAREYPPPDGDPGVFGYLNYVTPNQVPRLSVAGSTVDDGSAPGGNAVVTWYFSYPQGAIPFTLRGEIHAELYPPAPAIELPLGVTSWNGYVEAGEPLSWLVYDTEDDETKPRVQENVVTICDAPFAGNVCSGNTVLATTVGAGPHDGTFGRTAFDFVAPAGLTPGQLYWLRAVNRWDPDGEVAVDYFPVTGSLPLEQQFFATGRPTLITPVGGEPIQNGALFEWSVVSPSDFLANPVDWDRATYQLCADAACTVLVAEGFLDVSYALDPPFTYTYTLFIDLGPVLSAVNTYWWRVRNLFEGRVGPWTASESFVYGGP